MQEDKGILGRKPRCPGSHSYKLVSKRLFLLCPYIFISFASMLLVVGYFCCSVQTAKLWKHSVVGNEWYQFSCKYCVY